MRSNTVSFHSFTVKLNTGIITKKIFFQNIPTTGICCFKEMKVKVEGLASNCAATRQLIATFRLVTFVIRAQLAGTYKLGVEGGVGKRNVSQT